MAHMKHILFSCSLKKSQSSAFPCFEKAFPLKYSYSSYEHHHHRCCSDFFLREEAHFQWHITNFAIEKRNDDVTKTTFVN